MISMGGTSRGQKKFRCHRELIRRGTNFGAGPEMWRHLLWYVLMCMETQTTVVVWSAGRLSASPYVAAAGTDEGGVHRIVRGEAAQKQNDDSEEPALFKLSMMVVCCTEENHLQCACVNFQLFLFVHNRRDHFKTCVL